LLLAAKLVALSFGSLELRRNFLLIAQIARQVAEAPFMLSISGWGWHSVRARRKKIIATLPHPLRVLWPAPKSHSRRKGDIADRGGWGIPAVRGDDLDSPSLVLEEPGRVCTPAWFFQRPGPSMR
jgi:hypothetical protein